MPHEELKKKFPEEGSLCKKMCGRCCTNTAPVEREEAMEIADWIVQNIEVEDLKAQFEHFDEHPGQCPFLKPDKGCFVYPVRPMVCRMFGHIPDVPGMPKKWSQQCPEGVAFTQIEMGSDLVDEALLFMIKGKEQSIRTMDFRLVGLVDGTGQQVDMPPKPGSAFEKMRQAKGCYRCGASFKDHGNKAYLEGPELLCEPCEMRPE